MPWCPVPRFFFDIHDDRPFLPDKEGTEFPDAQTARDKAVSTLAEIARYALPDGPKKPFVVAIRDESGTPVFRAAMSVVEEWLTA